MPGLRGQRLVLQGERHLDGCRSRLGCGRRRAPGAPELEPGPGQDHADEKGTAGVRAGPLDRNDLRPDDADGPRDLPREHARGRLTGRWSEPRPDSQRAHRPDHRRDRLHAGELEQGKLERRGRPAARQLVAGELEPGELVTCQLVRHAGVLLGLRAGELEHGPAGRPRTSRPPSRRAPRWTRPARAGVRPRRHGQAGRPSSVRSTKGVTAAAGPAESWAGSGTRTRPSGHRRRAPSPGTASGSPRA